MITRNTTIPTKKTEIFSTASDNQPSVEIHVLQGEREMASYNRTLGRFHLDGIPPAPRGIPKVEVTFDIDANGILHVSAKDLGTGKQQAITITGHSGLDEKEIDRMVKDAEANAAEDKKRRETIDARNHADQLVYGLEKLLRENKEKIPAEEADRLQKEIENTKKAIESDDTRPHPQGHRGPVASLAQADGDDVPAGRPPGRARGRRTRRRVRRQTARLTAATATAPETRARSSTPKSSTTIRKRRP